MKKQSGWKDVADETTIQDIGGFLLADLAEGIYSYAAILREYGQNAADAYRDLEDEVGKLSPAVRQIQIQLEGGNSVSIHDSGIGMDLDGIRDFKRIAVSSKAELERAGFRGIGIWAGFAACDELQVITTKLNSSKRYRLTLRFGEIRAHVNDGLDIKKLLDSRYQIQEGPADPSDHYTHLKLIHIKESKLLDLEELTRIVSHIFPCRIDPDFKHQKEISEKLVVNVPEYTECSVTINGNEIYKRFPENLTNPEFLQLNDSSGGEFGYVWFCKSPGKDQLKPKEHEMKNFRLRVHNIAVGDPGIYSEETLHPHEKLASGELLDWYVGEIHITSNQVRPNTPREKLELNTSSRFAVDAIRKFYSERIAYRRAESEVRNHLDRLIDIKKDLESGSLTQDAAKAKRYLSELKRYNALSTGKKAKAEDSVKRKILKRYEQSKKNVIAERKQLIDELLKIVPNGAKSATKSAKASVQIKPAQLKGAGAIAKPSADFEQILSDVLGIVEDNLGEQHALAEKLSSDIQSVFEEYGVLVTV